LTGYAAKPEKWLPLLERTNAALPANQKLPARFRFHDLRHTAATFRMVQGDNPKVVQELLGHARVAITSDLYSHVMPSMQAQSAERLDRTLSRLVK
jgi:integrase